MTEELQILRAITDRLESEGMDYMLTGSVALNCYPQPRMTRDIDLVVVFVLQDVDRIMSVLGPGITLRTSIGGRGEPHCYRLRHGLSKGMVSNIDPDRYADTGFSIDDTSPEINDLLFQRMMERSTGERLRMGFEMTATAKSPVWASLPVELGENARRAAFIVRFYGKSFYRRTNPLDPG